MCGLVGILGEVGKENENAFKTLVYIDAVRGMDSTGVFLFNGYTRKGELLKDVGGPEWFDWSTDFSTVLNKTSSTIYMGHNRAATKGEVTKENAHPFAHGDIVGCHNGTLFAKYTFEKGNSFGTDSEALIHHIAHNGIEDAWSKVDGAAAISFVDTKESTVNFIRNDQRPLWFCLSEDNRILIWASELWMIQAAKSRFNAQKKWLNASSPNPNFFFSFKKGKKGTIDLVTRKLEPLLERSYDTGNLCGFGGDFNYNDNWKKRQEEARKREEERSEKRKKEQAKEQKRQQKEQKKAGKVDVSKIGVNRTLNRGVDSMPRQKILTLPGDKEFNETLPNDIDYRPCTHSSQVLSKREFKRNTNNQCSICGDAVDFTDMEVLIYNESLCACKLCNDILEREGMDLREAIH